MTKPTPSEKALLVATIAAGIYADGQAWRDYDNEAVEGDTWDTWVHRKAKKVAFQIWKDANK